LAGDAGINAAVRLLFKCGEVFFALFAEPALSTGTQSGSKDLPIRKKEKAAKGVRGFCLARTRGNPVRRV
jgi:hypothetical protein